MRQIERGERVGKLKAGHAVDFKLFKEELSGSSIGVVGCECL